MKQLRILVPLSLVLAMFACTSSSSSTTVADDAGPSGACSGADKLTFHLNVPSDRTYCEGKGGTCFKSTFVTVKTTDGLPVIQQQTGCTPACSEDCKETACPDICTLPTAIPPSGADLEWDGTYYLHASCGAVKTNCLAPFCVTEGTYVATMCAFVTADSDAGLPACSEPGGAVTPTCVDVTFTWPPAPGTVVTGTLP